MSPPERPALKVGRRPVTDLSEVTVSRTADGAVIFSDLVRHSLERTYAAGPLKGMVMPFGS